MMFRFEESGILAVKLGRGCKPSVMQRAVEIVTAVVAQVTKNAHGIISERAISRNLDIPHSTVLTLTWKWSYCHVTMMPICSILWQVVKIGHGDCKMESQSDGIRSKKWFCELF